MTRLALELIEEALAATGGLRLDSAQTSFDFGLPGDGEQFTYLPRKVCNFKVTLEGTGNDIEYGIALIKAPQELMEEIKRLNQDIDALVDEAEKLRASLDEAYVSSYER